MKVLKGEKGIFSFSEASGVVIGHFLEPLLMSFRGRAPGGKRKASLSGKGTVSGA